MIKKKALRKKNVIAPADIKGKLEQVAWHKAKILALENELQASKIVKSGPPGKKLDQLGDELIKLFAGYKCTEVIGGVKATFELTFEDYDFVNITGINLALDSDEAKKVASLLLDIGWFDDDQLETWVREKSKAYRDICKRAKAVCLTLDQWENKYNFDQNSFWSEKQNLSNRMKPSSWPVVTSKTKNGKV